MCSMLVNRHDSGWTDISYLDSGCNKYMTGDDTTLWTGCLLKFSSDYGLYKHKIVQSTFICFTDIGFRTLC